MGAAACSFKNTPEKEKKVYPPSKTNRRVRTKAAAEHQPAVAAVLENYDLLHEILMKLAPGNGCSLATREALARVNRLWQEVALTLPVALNLSMPLSDTQVEALAGNAIPCIRHIGFAGGEEERAWQVLGSKAFQQGSGRSLHSVSGLALQDDMTALSQLAEVRRLGVCKPCAYRLVDLVRGTTFSLQPLGVLSKLTSLSLRDLAGPRTGLDLSGLPSSLKDLKLVNTCLIHHPDMQLPADLHLDSLTAYVVGKGTNVLPLELLKRTKQAIVRGSSIQLSGEPIDSPAMEDDSMDIVINGGLLFLFAFSTVQTTHQDCPEVLLEELSKSDLQVLRLCTEEGGSISLVSRSDCRKQLRWKAIETDEAVNFARHAESLAEKPGAGFGCTIEKRHQDGGVRSMCLVRTGSAESSQSGQVSQLLLQARHAAECLEDIQAQVRYLNRLHDANARQR